MKRVTVTILLAYVIPPISQQITCLLSPDLDTPSEWSRRQDLSVQTHNVGECS